MCRSDDIIEAVISRVIYSCEIETDKEITGYCFMKFTNDNYFLNEAQIRIYNLALRCNVFVFVNMIYPSFFD